MISKKSLIISILYLLLIGVILYLSIVYSESKLQAFFLIAISLNLIIPIALRSVKFNFNIFEPLAIANFSFAIMFFARPLTNLITDQTTHLGYTIITNFNEALFLAWTGILFFHLGYFSSLGIKICKIFPKPPVFQPNTAFFFACFFVILGATLFYIFINTQGGFEVIPYLLQGRQKSNSDFFLSSTGYLYNGILMWGPASLIFFAIAIVNKRVKMFIPFLITLLVLFFLFGARGARSHLFPIALSIPTFWYLWKKRKPHLLTIFVTFYVTLSFFGWIRDIRNVETKYNIIDQLKISFCSPLTTVKKIMTEPDKEMFDSMANELLVIPEILPFMHGSSVKDIFIRALPRSLFPNKPLEANDQIVSVLWYEHYSQYRASPCFSLIGVLYADSGYISVVIGMFLIGSILSAFYTWYKLNSESTTAQVIYSMGLPFIVILLRGSIPDTLARMFFYFAPLFLLLFFNQLVLHRSTVYNN